MKMTHDNALISANIKGMSLEHQNLEVEYRIRDAERLSLSYETKILSHQNSRLRPSDQLKPSFSNLLLYCLPFELSAFVSKSGLLASWLSEVIFKIWKASVLFTCKKKKFLRYSAISASTARMEWICFRYFILNLNSINWQKCFFRIKFQRKVFLWYLKYLIIEKNKAEYSALDASRRRLRGVTDLRTARRTDGRMDGRTDGQTDRRMDRWKDGLTYTQIPPVFYTTSSPLGPLPKKVF